MGGLSLHPDPFHSRITEREHQIRNHRRRRRLKYVLAHAFEDFVWRFRLPIILVAVVALAGGAVAVGVSLQRELKHKEHLKGIESRYSRLVQQLDDRIREAEGRVAVVPHARLKMSETDDGSGDARVGYYLQKKAPEDAETESLAVGRMEILPGKKSFTPSASRDDTVMFVESGKGVVVYLDEARTIEPGAAVHFAKGTRVAINNVGDTMLKLQFVRWATPAPEPAEGNAGSASDADRKTAPAAKVGRLASMARRPDLAR